MGNKTRGLYPEGKFIVRRRDGTDKPGGKHDSCNYFVLDVTHDPHAIPALRSYAASARKDGYELLANDLEGIAAAATTPPPETAVGGEAKRATCANCAESLVFNDQWEHEYDYRPECLNAVPRAPVCGFLNIKGQGFRRGRGKVNHVTN